jgi:lysophospholipase L1-like esterase
LDCWFHPSPGRRPYQKTKASLDAVGFDPQIVIVMLGTNDTCGLPRGNWEKSAAFATDAAAMLRSLANPGHRVIVALPTPTLPDRPDLKPERVADLRERAPRLATIRDWWRQEAAKLDIEIVDLSDVFDARPLGLPTACTPRRQVMTALPRELQG